jgi:hypothetical protein
MQLIIAYRLAEVKKKERHLRKMWRLYLGKSTVAGRTNRVSPTEPLSYNEESFHPLQLYVLVQIDRDKIDGKPNGQERFSRFH